MFIIYSIFMFVYTFALTGNKQCSCIEITEQNECSTAQCNWVNSTCIAPICTDYKNQTECDIIQECAWTNDGQCDTFTACSNYTLNSTLNQQCYLKSSTCIPGTPVNDTVTCIQGYVNCYDVTDENICTGLVQSDGQMCWWNNNNCIPQDVTYCTSINDAKLCDQLLCIYDENKKICTARLCNGINQKDDCTFLQGNLIGTTSICQYVNDTCLDADESTISSFDKSNCYNNTGGTYSWNGTNCLICTGSSSSFGIILEVFLTFIFI